jgi:hypothetical protein
LSKVEHRGTNSPEAVDPARLQELVRTIADRMEERVEELVDEFWERLFEVPAVRAWDRPQPGGQQWDSARINIGRWIAGLRAGFVLPSECPPEVNRTARMAVDFGVPLEGAVQIYRTGLAAGWEGFYAEVEALELSDTERRALIRRGSRYLFDYSDRCAWWVSTRHLRERDRRLRSEEHRRIQAVRDLLDGGDPELEPLGYRLDAEHLGVIARGETAEAAVHALAREMGGPFLAVAADRDTWWAWVHWPAEVDATARRRLLHFRPPAGTSIAIGGPSPGRDGFRDAHGEAQQALRVALRRPSPVTLYDDVALEALAAEDEARARSFVTRELGELADDDERTAILRETLRAYLAVAQNGSSAAALLGVHERTVANRLRAIEQRLGRPVSTRHAELDTALRLYELLHD